MQAVNSVQSFDFFDLVHSLNSKKNKEYFYLSKFKDIVTNFPKGKLEFTESPDFLLHEENQLIGIEMVVFYSEFNNNRLKYKEEDFNNKNVLHELKLLYNCKFGDCYHSIRFLPYIGCNLQEITNSEKNQIVDKIQYRILHHLYGINRLVNSVLGFQEDILDQYFHFVDIDSGILLTPNKWRMIETNFIGSSTDDLKNIIMNKEEKVSKYKEKCHSIFLLIVAEDYHENQRLSLEQIESKFLEIKSSKFDKIFYFDFKANQYVEW